MKQKPVDECEVKSGTQWVAIGIEEALERRGEKMRCPECHGPVRPHKEGTTDQRAHFEHLTKHVGCALKDNTFSGTSSPHPNALS
jgi:hypothetical protein